MRRFGIVLVIFLLQIFILLEIQFGPESRQRNEGDFRSSANNQKPTRRNGF
jgi:hypothetical protein